MSKALPRIYLVRHGETAWSASGQHTGGTDIPLSQRGEENAAGLRERLHGIRPVRILCSPLRRARATCDLAGFGGTVEIEPDLTEWGYGDYEGRTTADIRKERPDWSLFRDGCPNGEPLDLVGERADRSIRGLRALNGDALLFGHSHMFRVLVARWLALAPRAGAFFQLAPASISVLSFEHTTEEPVIALLSAMTLAVADV